MASIPTILTNTHDFKKFRSGPFIYVDKTKYVYQLMQSEMTQCFLSRPRRFGKSLLINMMKELFLGNKSLFEDLYIYDRYDFKPYPVIHLSFTMLEYPIHVSAEMALYQALTMYLSTIAENHGVDKPDGPFLGTLLTKIYQKYQTPIVLLIDEYDKPLLSYINAPDPRKEVLKVLKQMFSPLKDLADIIHFLFITGISKFSQVSIFSDLNNLDDLTMHTDYATIAGFTQEELEFYFKDYIIQLAGIKDITTDNLLDQIKLWYNGYSWDGKHFVYAPFSISHLFKQRAFNNYWFSSATPSFLAKVVEELEKGKITLDSFESCTLSESEMEKYDITNIKLMPLLFQSGYLSLKKKNRYRLELHFPNHEVRESFNTGLFDLFSKENLSEFQRLSHSIESGDIDQMITSIKHIMATIPHQILDKKENVYRSHFYTILKTINENTQSEISTNLGRIDTVMETSDTIYIFEFKMQSALQGIRQIKKKRYADAYINKDKKLVLIGVKFSQQSRNIADYKYEHITQKDMLKTDSEKRYTEKILVLYDAQDETLCNLLMMHLQPIKHYGIACFDHITYDEIQLLQAFSKSKCIICLLSSQFLASDLFNKLTEYIQQNSSIRLFPLITRPCAYTTIKWLADIATNKTPLVKLPDLEQNEQMVFVVEEVAKTLHSFEKSS